MILTYSQDLETSRQASCQKINGGFPGGPVDKNPPANAGDTGSISGLGRPHMHSQALGPAPRAVGARPGPQRAGRSRGMAELRI